LAKGLSPTDIAHEAIARLFEGTRDWNPDRDPDVLQYLKGVVDSLMSALVRSAEVAEVRVSVAYVETDSSTEDEVSQSSVAVGSAPLHQAPLAPDVAAETNELQVKIMSAVSGDDELELFVLCLAEGYTKRAEIAQNLGISVDEVTNLGRRLRRTVDREMLSWQGK
jgi:DNA-directed RNA polymerase specialized sigma24 family protein